MEEIWSISTETEGCSNSNTSATILYEEDACCLSGSAPFEEELCFQEGNGGGRDWESPKTVLVIED